jgi:hypothetical protein
VSWLLARLVVDLAPSHRSTSCRTVAPALLRLRRAPGRVVSLLDFSSVGCTGSHCVPSHSVACRDYPSPGRNESTSPMPCDQVPRLLARLVADYFAYVVRPGASARRAARRRLLRLCRTSGCLDTSRSSPSTTSPTPRDRVPRHIARHVVRLVTRLVITHFAYDVRSCLGTSCGTSRDSSSTTSPTPRVRVPRHVTRLVVDYFAYATRPGASTHHATCRAAHRVARCRLLRLRHATRCLDTSRGTSCGSSRDSSSPTSPMMCDRVPRLLALLVVDHAPSRCSNCCPAALALVVRLVTPPRISTSFTN